MRSHWFVLVILVVLLGFAFAERRNLITNVMALTSSSEPPPLLDAADEGAGVRWHDDYFTLQEVAPRTFAIGEPRYHQQNYSYLIIGEDRALLFDAGPGVRDIRQVAEALTDKPIVFLPSHFHYDHVGNDVTFEEIAVVDLPYIRDRADGNQLTLTRAEHLGYFERMTAPTWEVDYWWPAGTEIDLGQRSLTLLYTPGHTTDSISLWDRDGGMVFSGDYLYPAELYAFLSNSRMGDYLSTSESLLATLPNNVVFFGAHRSGPPGAPRQLMSDLVDLNRSLISIRDETTAGEGVYPQVFYVNEQMVILAEPRWLQDWD
ncbi:MAG: MBL fold metallo-hydrolase [Gammaproteobacteria bacterium]|nr:MBL fold metallo-hydrolase [Gammaproteobacteria bacterium]